MDSVEIAFAQKRIPAIEAVSRAQEAGKQFNVILMDFQMPHIDATVSGYSNPTDTAHHPRSVDVLLLSQRMMTINRNGIVWPPV
jgi:CheY-like chemotaxis protein